MFHLRMVRKGGGEMKEQQRGCPAFSKRGGEVGALCAIKREILQRVMLIFLLVMLFGFVMTAVVSAYGDWGWEYSETITTGKRNMRNTRMTKMMTN